MRFFFALVALYIGAAFPSFAQQQRITSVQEIRRPVLTQAEFENFMSCYGHLAGSVDLLARIRPMVDDPAQIEDIRRQGIDLMNSRFANPYEQITASQYRYDLFEGEQARQRGRMIFDSVETLDISVQYERFRMNGALSDACLAVSDKALQMTRARQSAINSFSE